MTQAQTFTSDFNAALSAGLDDRQARAVACVVSHVGRLEEVIANAQIDPSRGIIELSRAFYPR